MNKDEGKSTDPQQRLELSGVQDRGLMKLYYICVQL